MQHMADNLREVCARSWKTCSAMLWIVIWRHLSFTMLTAGCLCVLPKHLGDSYRENICQSLWLQSFTTTHSYCQSADNLTLLRPISQPLPSPWNCFKRCNVAGWAPCVVSFLPNASQCELVLKCTQTIKNITCVTSEAWFESLWFETISRIIVLTESLEE